MKTLALVQGDLSPAPGGYLLYSGVPKIYQDLTMALQEEYGADTIHPRWGSILKRYVGQPLTPDTQAKVVTEINRVLNNYISVQNAKIKADNLSGNASSLTSDDVVQSVSSITANPMYDSLVISVILQTISRQDISITQVVTA